MLSPKVTSTLLYVHPQVKDMIKEYNIRLSILMGLNYNSQGIPVEQYTNEMVSTLAKKEMIKIFDEIITTAISLIDELDAEIIREHYFNGILLDDIAKMKNMERPYIVYRRNRALRKLGSHMSVLGLTKDLICEYFDDDDTFIETAEQVSLGEMKNDKK